MNKLVKNLKGQRFGRWIVIKRAKKSLYGNNVAWECVCNCGNKRIVDGCNLRRGVSQSCGCLHNELAIIMARKKAKDLTGMKFGRLTAIKFVRVEGRKIMWLFHCDCGVEKIIDKRRIVPPSSQIKSCGCLKKEIHSKIFLGRNNPLYEHGMSKTNFYGVWNTMIQRCHNPNSTGFPRYGLKNIKVYTRWHRFKNFLYDMYESYQEHIKQFGKKETQIDRIDGTKNYSLKNCRWVTLKEQANNK